MSLGHNKWTHHPWTDGGNITDGKFKCIFVLEKLLVLIIFFLITLALNKGVFQCSVLGSLLFNIFINDLLLKFDGLCLVYNYADDDTIGTNHSNASILKSRLVKYNEIAMKWFEKIICKQTTMYYLILNCRQYPVEHLSLYPDSKQQLRKCPDVMTLHIL